MNLRARMSADLGLISRLTGHMSEWVSYTTSGGTISIRGVWSSINEQSEQQIGNGFAQFRGEATFIVSAKELETPTDGAVIERTMPDGTTERWNVTDIAQHGSWGWELRLRHPQISARVPGKRINQ